MLSPEYEQLFSREDIRKAVARVSAEVSRWGEGVWENSKRDVLALPVLRGGLFFFADLVREVTHSVEIAPVRTWAYHVESNSPSDVGISMEHVSAKGRSILLVDDICESGRTLAALKQKLLEQGAREVKAAVLIWRLVKDQNFTPDWAGFEYPGNEWCVGYGMDDRDRWRNLPYVGIIKQK